MSYTDGAEVTREERLAFLETIMKPDNARAQLDWEDKVIRQEQHAVLLELREREHRTWTTTTWHTTEGPVSEGGYLRAGERS